TRRSSGLVCGLLPDVEVAFSGLSSHAHYLASFSLLIWNPPQTMRWSSCSRMTTGAAVYPAAFASSRISGCWSRGFSVQGRSFLLSHRLVASHWTQLGRLYTVIIMGCLSLRFRSGAWALVLRPCPLASWLPRWRDYATSRVRGQIAIHSWRASCPLSSRYSTSRAVSTSLDTVAVDVPRRAAICSTVAAVPYRSAMAARCRRIRSARV